MSVDWNTPEPSGETEANQPAAPSEVVVPATVETPVVETPATVETEGAEKTTSTETPTEPVKDEATTETQGANSPEESVVKREGRKLFFEAEKIGGPEAVREAISLQAALQDSNLPAEAKLQALYQSAPRAYEDLRKEMFFSYWDSPAQRDALFQDALGQGVTVEKVKELLAGQVAPSPTTARVPTEEELSTMSNAEVLQLLKTAQGVPVDDVELPDAVKARLAELDQIKKDYPQLKDQVTSLSAERERVQQEQTLRMGQEFLTEAMSPAVKMMEEAGLKVLPTDSPEEKAWKEEIWDTVILKTHKSLTESPENRPLADDIELFITKGDRQSAWSKMRAAQARAELAASKLIPIYTSSRQKQRESQTSVLDKERPPMIPGGQTSFGSQQPELTGRNAWNDPAEQDRWKDIAASLA